MVNISNSHFKYLLYFRDASFGDDYQGFGGGGGGGGGMMPSGGGWGAGGGAGGGPGNIPLMGQPIIDGSQPGLVLLILKGLRCF